jgi:hypothetical protein
MENEELDTMEGSDPSKTEKESAHGVRAVNVGAPATVRSFAPTVGKRRKTQGDNHTSGLALT